MIGKKLSRMKIRRAFPVKKRNYFKSREFINIEEHVETHTDRNVALGK
jgi:hypothetical protein